jgi:hypothetical protein
VQMLGHLNVFGRIDLEQSWHQRSNLGPNILKFGQSAGLPRLKSSMIVDPNVPLQPEAPRHLRTMVQTAMRVMMVAIVPAAPRTVGRIIQESKLHLRHVVHVEPMRTNHPGCCFGQKMGRKRGTVLKGFCPGCSTFRIPFLCRGMVHPFEGNKPRIRHGPRLDLRLIWATSLMTAEIRLTATRYFTHRNNCYPLQFMITSSCLYIFLRETVIQRSGIENVYKETE